MNREVKRCFSKKTLYIFSTISFLWFLSFCVINNTKQVKSDSVISRDYFFGDTEKLLVGYETYGNNIKLGKWNQSIVTANERLAYNKVWTKVLRTLGMPPGCNAVDIGANDGDTAFNLAEATQGGFVVAFEMGPTIQFLNFNKRLNPGFKLDIHNVAVSNEFKKVQFESGCQGCNGGIPREGPDMYGNKLLPGLSVPAVRLLPYLEQHYTREFINNICIMKIDTEGHDVVILDDLKSMSWRPPVLWIEWMTTYILTCETPNAKIDKCIREDDDYCSPESAKLFETVLDLGYEIFEPRFPLRKMRGCKNKYFEFDLLLIEKELVTNLIKEKKFDLRNMNLTYEIEVYDE